MDHLIKTQLLRGGAFEALTVCRFPHGSLGFELEWYHKYLRASTGSNFSVEQLNQIGDRILNLIRAFWVREYGTKWSRDLDVPPMRWFKEPLTEGPITGAVLGLRKIQRHARHLLSETRLERKWSSKKGNFGKVGFG